MKRLFRSLMTPADALAWRIRVPLLIFFVLSATSDVLSAGDPVSAPVITAVAAAMVLCVAVLRTGIATLLFIPLLAVSVAQGTAPQLGLPVLVMIALVAGTCTLPRVVAFVVCCGTWALWSASDGLFASASVTWAMLPAFLMVAVVGVVIRSLIEKQRRDRREINELTGEATRARAAERQRLAGELHDIVAHDLTMVVMLSELAEAIDDKTYKQETLTRIERASRSALSDLRRLFEVLERDTLADDESAEQATTAIDHPLADVRESINSLTELGFRVGVREEGDANRVDGSLRLALRRSLREALSNVAKYGEPGGRVAVDYLVTEAEVIMRVTNTVPPVGRSGGLNKGGTGLIHMQEQADAFGGTFRVENAGANWRVELVLPCEPTGLASRSTPVGYGAAALPGRSARSKQPPRRPH